jgi:hypothetical protein
MREGWAGSDDLRHVANVFSLELVAAIAAMKIRYG